MLLVVGEERKRKRKKVEKKMLKKIQNLLISRKKQWLRMVMPTVELRKSLGLWWVSQFSPQGFNLNKNVVIFLKEKSVWNFFLSNYRLGLEAKKEENLSDWFSQVREFCTITNH